MAFSAIRIAPYGKFRKLVRDLNRAESILSGRRTQRAMKDLAEAAKGFLVGGIENGRTGWAELNEITKAIKGHDRILVDSGSFVGSIRTWKEGERWYAGIPEGAQGDKGQDLHLVGAVHEEGATVPVSDEMRGFFAAKGFPLRADTKFVTIPPRPWFAPARKELDEYAEKMLEPLVESILEEIG